MSRRHITPLRRAYVWGAVSNVEPPDDDEDVLGFHGVDMPAEVDEHALHLAADSYHGGLAQGAAA